jgi:hypothetical protein
MARCAAGASAAQPARQHAASFAPLPLYRRCAGIFSLHACWRRRKMISYRGGMAPAGAGAAQQRKRNQQQSNGKNESEKRRWQRRMKSAWAWHGGGSVIA